MENILACSLGALSSLAPAGPSAPNPTAFSEQLMALIAFAKNGFKEMPADFKLRGAISSTVTRSEDRGEVYTGLFATHLSQERALKFWISLSDRIEKAIQQEYELADGPESSDATAFVFVSTCNCKLEAVKVCLDTTAGKGDVYLEIYYLNPQDHFTPTNLDIARRSKQIIVDILGVTEDKVTLDACLSRDLGADSLEFVELLMEFEEAYSISVPDEDAFCIKTYGDIVDYLEQHVG